MAEKIVDRKGRQKCTFCKGTGKQQPSGWKCDVCGGSGKMTIYEEPPSDTPSSETPPGDAPSDPPSDK